MEAVVHLLPEDVGVDDANVQQAPEDVFPPPPASTTHTIVRPELVHPVDTTHQGVVLPDTAWSWHVTRHVVPPHLSHHIQPLVVRRNHVDVTSRLSRHLTNMTLSSFVHLMYSPGFSFPDASLLGYSRRCALVVPQRYVFTAKRKMLKLPISQRNQVRI